MAELSDGGCCSPLEAVDLLVIGAGQAGLATAFEAARAGLRPVVLEASDQAGGSWPLYYESLELFSPARFSALPGKPFPGDPERYPRRDEVVEYLRSYAEDLDADLRFGQRVEEVAPEAGRLTVRTASTNFTAQAVIAASGSFGAPHRPRLPGIGDFGGEILHAAEYRRPEAFAGGHAIVVGGGNSAVQIATELAGSTRVTLATRAPIKWMPQRPLGHDLHRWLTASRLDVAPLGRWLRGRSPSVLDDGRYRAALASGNPKARPMFERLEKDAVRWSDGTSEPVDAVITATGYRPDLYYLAGAGALDEEGFPLHRRGVSTTVPGLGYVGLEFGRSFSSATLRGVARDARHVIGRLQPRRSRAHEPRPVPCCVPST